MAVEAKRIKRSRASLIGGMIVGLGVAALGYVVAGEMGLSAAAQGTIALVFGGAFGTWVFLADL